MTKKKEKVTKIIHGTSIQHMSFHMSWITCTLDNGEKVTISADKLFKLLDQFDLQIESYGNHFRTKSFESNDNFGKIDYEEDYPELISEMNSQRIKLGIKLPEN